MPIDPLDIRGQVITDIQMQPFSGQALLPGGAVATVNEYVFVLGNGKTLRIAGIRLVGNAPRLVGRLSKTTQIEDTESVT